MSRCVKHEVQDGEAKVMRKMIVCSTTNYPSMKE